MAMTMLEPRQMRMRTATRMESLEGTNLRPLLQRLEQLTGTTGTPNLCNADPRVWDQVESLANEIMAEARAEKFDGLSLPVTRAQEAMRAVRQARAMADLRAQQLDRAKDEQRAQFLALAEQTADGMRTLARQAQAVDLQQLRDQMKSRPDAEQLRAASAQQLKADRMEAARRAEGAQREADKMAAIVRGITAGMSDEDVAAVCNVLDEWGRIQRRALAIAQDTTRDIDAELARRAAE